MNANPSVYGREPTQSAVSVSACKEEDGIGERAWIDRHSADTLAWRFVEI
ncbi:hypothetical protein [Alteromonas sp. S015]